MIFDTHIAVLVRQHADERMLRQLGKVHKRSLDAEMTKEGFAIL